MFANVQTSRRKAGSLQLDFGSQLQAPSVGFCGLGSGPNSADSAIDRRAGIPGDLDDAAQWREVVSGLMCRTACRQVVVNFAMTYMTGVVAAKLTPDHAEFLDVMG